MTAVAGRSFVERESAFSGGTVTRYHGATPVRFSRGSSFDNTSSCRDARAAKGSRL